MSDFNEAVVLIAKCGESHKTYDQRNENLIVQQSGFQFYLQAE